MSKLKPGSLAWYKFLAEQIVDEYSEQLPGSQNEVVGDYCDCGPIDGITLDYWKLLDAVEDVIRERD